MQGVKQGEVGLQLVIGYKVIKALIELALGLTLGWFAFRGEMSGLGHLAREIRQHFTSALALDASEFLFHFGTPRYGRITSMALGLDAAFSGFEGWALYRRFFWAPWLVVLATASFVPFEIQALMRHLGLIRLTILILNVSVVVYLAQRALREHRALKAHAHADVKSESAA